MTKTEFIAKVADHAGVSKKQARDIIESVLETITKTLKKGDEVQITGFGKFLVRKRAARMGRNPRTGAKIRIPASKTPAFKAGKTLKDAVN